MTPTQCDWLNRLTSSLEPVDGPFSTHARSDGDLNGAPIALEKPRDAAVLAPLIEVDQQWHVMLTLRAAHLTKHAGQISFPGGRKDTSDPDLAYTALREAREEIGLNPSDVRLLGAFDPYTTVTGFRVRPFVGVIEQPFTPRPDHREVEAVFTVPLAFLMDQKNHRIEKREFRGAMRAFYAMPYEDRYIWGATAGMLRALSERVQSRTIGRIAANHTSQ